MAVIGVSPPTAPAAGMSSSRNCPVQEQTNGRRTSWIAAAAAPAGTSNLWTVAMTSLVPVGPPAQSVPATEGARDEVGLPAQGLPAEPTGGLEPPTPSLRVMCSTS